MNKIADAYMTVNETADLLGVHRRTVRRYLQHGHLTPLREAGTPRVYIARSEVLAARENAIQRHSGELPERPLRRNAE